MFCGEQSAGWPLDQLKLSETIEAKSQRLNSSSQEGQLQLVHIPTTLYFEDDSV